MFAKFHLLILAVSISDQPKELFTQSSRDLLRQSPIPNQPFDKAAILAASNGMINIRALIRIPKQRKRAILIESTRRLVCCKLSEKLMSMLSLNGDLFRCKQNFFTR